MLKLNQYYFYGFWSAILIMFVFVRVPFDWRSPSGYAIVIIFETVICLTVTYPCKASLCFLIGSFWALLTIIEDIANDLHGLNAKRREFNEQFYNLVHQFSTLKELSDVICVVWFQDFETRQNHQISFIIKTFMDYFICRLVEKFNIACGSTILLVFIYTYATITVTFYVYVTLLVEYSSIYVLAYETHENLGLYSVNAHVRTFQIPNIIHLFQVIYQKWVFSSSSSMRLPERTN